MPRGKRAVAIAMWPFKHQRVALAHLRRGLAERYGAGHVGGPVEILRAGIDEVERAGLNSRSLCAETR